MANYDGQSFPDLFSLSSSHLLAKEKYGVCLDHRKFAPLFLNAFIAHEQRGPQHSLMIAFQRILNLLFIFVLCIVLIAGYIYQFLKSEEPCALCILQRLGMVAIAVSLMMNLRFGIRVQHYGLAILSAVSGRLVSLRQIEFHICPEFPAFGEPVLGLDLYVWAFIVFTCALVACAVLLMIYGYLQPRSYPLIWNFWDKFAFGLVAFLTFANFITTLFDCGFSTCF